jgi:hypothetical protein
MGNFYVNVTLVDVRADEVRRKAPRPSFVAFDGADAVVFAAADDAGAPVTGAGLTHALGCAGISIGVHDDDILFWEVHRQGETLATGAVPDPAEYFGVDLADLDALDGDGLDLGDLGLDEDEEVDPAADLVAALGRGDVDAVRQALAADQVFATDRHVALVEALQLPRAAVGWGHRYLAADWADHDLGRRLPGLERLEG